MPRSRSENAWVTRSLWPSWWSAHRPCAARETAEIVLKHAHLKVEVIFAERIYEASLRDLLHVVAEIPHDKQVAMMIGHNPGFEELVSFLSGEYRRMPTCALAKIRLDVASWKDVRAGEGTLEWFITPKELIDD